MLQKCINSDKFLIYFQWALQTLFLNSVNKNPSQTRKIISEDVFLVFTIYKEIKTLPYSKLITK